MEAQNNPEEERQFKLIPTALLLTVSTKKFISRKDFSLGYRVS